MRTMQVFCRPRCAFGARPFQNMPGLFSPVLAPSARIVKAIDVLGNVSSVSWRICWGLRHITSASMVLRPRCRGFTTVAFAAYRALEAVPAHRVLGSRESNVCSRDPRGGGRFGGTGLHGPTPAPPDARSRAVPSSLEPSVVVQAAATEALGLLDGRVFGELKVRCAGGCSSRQRSNAASNALSRLRV